MVLLNLITLDQDDGIFCFPQPYNSDDMCTVCQVISFIPSATNLKQYAKSVTVKCIRKMI